MNLWCCLWFNRKKEKEEEEKCNFFEHMNNNEDIFGNASDDEDGSEEAKFFQGFGSWPGTRRSEGESISVNASLVPVSRPESPVADKNRDSSHKRAKFYKWLLGSAWVCV
ncbi:hypothetical protein QL285_013371 [Trifolium repens]|nr:hypothetical protein QL285_013371 [Trifolium repens]